MSRYIDADKLLSVISEYLEEYSDIDSKGNHTSKWCAMKEAEMAINAQPAADVRENVRGEWIYTKHYLDEVKNEMCNNYCKWPDQWDEEKEGMDLIDSEKCMNCPLNKL